ncbi:MAG TPA: protein kinase [Gemmatimonadaceae bacterium]|nr:protein kinase [Gemmatimonadaceae bacterium]
MPSTDRLRAALSDRYQIQHELGAGGMATVYLARDIKHNREVAMKVMRPDVSAAIGTDRFLSEVRIAAQLDHPNILTLIDSGEADGILYYVLPYVRGESLRAKLNRERQLELSEAVSITQQIGRALDYAHAKGVIHRDIKPENVLLHEGVAVLADFGIALAVKEAGGARLTGTGMSIGTPQYMSPEQATGDRGLDRRSDVYSLGAVFYEMVAGEPPVNGPTAQAIIAKLLVEKPVKLRVVRPAVTPAMEQATDRALGKVPADRFNSAGEFARALSAPLVAASATTAGPRWLQAGGLTTLAIVVLGVWVTNGKSSSTLSKKLSLGTPRQITSTGAIRIPTVSADKKMIAYSVEDCTTSPCGLAIEVADSDGGTTRRIAEGITSLHTLDISPDRRNVMFFGKYSGTEGSFVVPTLGGTPRQIAGGPASFYANGDSLVFFRSFELAIPGWMMIGGLDASPADSISIAHKGIVTRVQAVPGSSRIAYSVIDRTRVNLVAMDRSGKELGPIIVKSLLAAASSKALWLRTSESLGGMVSLIRVAFDVNTRLLPEKHDTVYTGKLTGVGISADDKTIVVDDRIMDFETWLLPASSFFYGTPGDARRITRSTKSRVIDLSPDGKFVALAETSEAMGREGIPWSIVSLDGGPSISLPGKHRTVRFHDSTTVELLDRVPAGIELALWDFRANKRFAAITVNDSTIDHALRVRNHGWIWQAKGTITYRRDGQHSDQQFAMPPWCRFTSQLAVSPDGRSVAFAGKSSLTEDSIQVGVLSLLDGRFTRKHSRVGANPNVRFLGNESLLLNVFLGPQHWAYYRISPDGTASLLGKPRLRHSRAVFSDDLKKVFAVSSVSRADAWMIEVNGISGVRR